MKKTESDSTAESGITTPSSTYDAPQAIERPVNAALPHKLEPHPLALALDGLKTSAATLRHELSNQSVRLADIARLTDEKTALLQAVDDETVPYVEGAARLAVIDQNLDVLQWTTNKRGVSAVAELHNQRDRAVVLKNSVLTAINAPAAEAYQLRYLARRAFMMGDGATAAKLVRKALRTSLKPLREEPGKTLATWIASEALNLLRLSPALKSRFNQKIASNL